MFSRSLSDLNNPSAVQFVTSVFWFPFRKFFKGYWLIWSWNHGYLSLVRTRAGKMPTPQENLSLVEQASCLFLKIVLNASSYLHYITNYQCPMPNAQCPITNAQLPFYQLCILIKKLPGQSLSQQQSCDYSCQR